MSENTKIEWCDHTFNPWEGCQKVGPGCDHCYAEKRNARFSGGVASNWGPGAPRRRTSASNWALPLRWNAQHEAFQTQHGRRQRVFCASLADVFDNAVDPSWRADLFDLIAATPHLDWLLLTKRIGNAWKMMADACGVSVMSARLPLPNVWLGATVTSQAEADRDIPKLLNIPARVRFLSMEPLLEPVDLRVIDIDGHCEIYPLRGTASCVDEDGEPAPDLPGLDWVIVGGESGPGARPMHPDWSRSLRDQCTAAGVPFLFKQWGEWVEVESDQTLRTACVEDAVSEGFQRGRDCVLARDGIRYDHPAELPEGAPGRWMERVGKKAAGRLLDGREWNEVPT